jgi:hypothetical protein
MSSSTKKLLVGGTIMLFIALFTALLVIGFVDVVLSVFSIPVIIEPSENCISDETVHADTLTIP